MYTVDQPQDASNERTDSSSSAMASFVQELYSSAFADLAKFSRSIADSFSLNDLEIEDDTTGEDKEGEGANLTRTTEAGGAADPIPKPGSSPNSEGTGKQADGKDGSDFSRKSVPNDQADTGPKVDNDTKKEANSKDGAIKENDGLDKGKQDFQKDLMPGTINEADAKLNVEGKRTTQKPFTKEDLLKEFEKGVGSLGPKLEEPNGKDKRPDKGSTPANPQHNNMFFPF